MWAASLGLTPDMMWASTTGDNSGSLLPSRNLLICACLWCRSVYPHRQPRILWPRRLTDPCHYAAYRRGRSFPCTDAVCRTSRALELLLRLADDVLFDSLRDMARMVSPRSIHNSGLRVVAIGNRIAAVRASERTRRKRCTLFA